MLRALQRRISATFQKDWLPLAHLLTALSRTDPCNSTDEQEQLNYESFLSACQARVRRAHRPAGQDGGAGAADDVPLAMSFADLRAHLCSVGKEIATMAEVYQRLRVLVDQCEVIICRLTLGVCIMSTNHECLAHLDVGHRRHLRN